MSRDETTPLPPQRLTRPKKNSMRKPRFPASPPNFGKRTTKNTTAAGNIVQQEEDEYIDYSPRGEDKFYREANGPYTNARQTRIILIFVFLWLLGLSVYIIVMPSSVAERGREVAPPILAPKRAPTKWHIPFNLVPDESNGRIMMLKVPHMNFDRLLRYDVCCRRGPYYVCRAVSKNVGIECYMTNQGEAVMHIGHPEMVGAACTFMWTETREV